MSLQLNYAGVDDNTRIEVSLCTTTHMARAVVQVRGVDGWANTGIGGVGQGCQDACADLFATLVPIGAAVDRLRSECPWTDQ